MFRILLITIFAFSFGVPAWAGSSDPFRPREGWPAPTKAFHAGIRLSTLQALFLNTHDLKSPSDPRPLATPTIPNNGQVPQDVAIGDWNRDGIPDLAIAYGYSDEVRWFFGTGSGKLIAGGALPVGIHPGTLDDLPRRLWVADFDGDGFLDLAVVCSGISAANPQGLTPATASCGILYGTPDGGFEPFQPVALWPAAMDSSPPQFATSLTGAVVDNAGGILLTVGFMDSRQVSLLRHRSGRRWEPAVVLNVATAGPGPVDLALADLDLDGQTDLVVLNRRDVQVWQGSGPGVFGPKTTVTAGQALTALALADFNQDGAWDLAVADGLADSMKILMGLNSAGQSPATARIAFPAGSRPYRMLRYDANQDGRDDLAVLFLSSQGGQILLGQSTGGDPPLAGASSFETALQPCALAAGHLNRDGWPDLAVVNQGDLTDAANPDLSFIAGHPWPGLDERIVLRNCTDPGLPRTSGLTRPRGLAWDAARRSLWTLDRRGGKLARLSEDGLPQETFPLNDVFPARQVADPHDIALDGTGDVWMTDRLAACVLHLEPLRGGVARHGFSTAGAGLNRPAGITFDPARNRLLVSDEAEPLIKAFSLTGALLASYQVSNGQPLVDLAWNAATGRVWGVPANDSDRICELTLNDASATAMAGRMIALASLAPVLAGQAVRAVAVDASARFWTLTDSGALIQATFEPRLASIRELSLLRRALVAAPEPEGTILLADGGLLSTLYRLTSAPLDSGARPGFNNMVRILESFALRGPGDSPLRICGLARTPGQIHVLDGVQGKVFRFDPRGAPAGSLALANLAGRRPQGLYVDPATLQLWITTPGRLLKYSAAGQLLAESPLPASDDSTAIGLGRQAGELAVLGTAGGAITILRQTGGKPAIQKKILFQTLMRPNPFQALTALPMSDSSNGWRLWGADDDAVLLTEQGAPSTAVRPGWRLYE